VDAGPSAHSLALKKAFISLRRLNDSTISVDLTLHFWQHRKS
jgi:hypothetical protein